LELAFDALARLDAGTDRVLRSCLRTFVADACLALDDDRAADLLATAAAEAESRGERWWLAETRRLQAELARRSGDAGQAEAALDEAEAVARGQGAGLVLTRIASARTALAG
jgi:hypothetical protein